MTKPTFQFSEIVSFTVMLLMIVALVAGQADANLRDASQATAITPSAVFDDHLSIEASGHLGAAVLSMTIDIASDYATAEFDYFRGEDE